MKIRCLAVVVLFYLPITLSIANPSVCFADGGSNGSKQQPQKPLTAEQAKLLFRLEPGLKIELVACEPQIESPVSIAFDEEGRLWVVEMRDYPNGPKKGERPQGKIRLLEKSDGKGRFAKSSVFAEDILFGNGLLPWSDGVLVTAAPYILRLGDSKRTGKADRREILFEGFAAENPQLRVSHPNLGLDNWIYVANGLRGGQVKASGKPSVAPINLSGMDFRFDLVHGRYEAISGMGQYGNTFDDWGHRFVCDNHDHLRHIVLPNRYVRRNPYLAVPAVVEDVSELEPGPLYSGGKIYPISRNWTTSSLHAGRFTAACGVFIYRGDLLSKEFRGAALTCDPTGNLVHEEILQQRGATYRSHPAKKGVEFLATTDEWFRPVFLTQGPDGALYVVDLYRAVIEHPDFMPEELKHRPDLLAGKERGRIWRIAPEKEDRSSSTPHLRSASIEKLVTLLDHPNAWWRTTAQRLLLERHDSASIQPLRLLVQSSTNPLAVAHAAWLLEAQKGLSESLVLHLLKNSEPRVREQGVILAEPYLKKDALLQQRVCELGTDVDSQVRFQVALSLGEWGEIKILEPLTAIFTSGIDDHWTREAVASSLSEKAGLFIIQLMDPARNFGRQADAKHLEAIKELAALVGARRDATEVANVLNFLGTLSSENSSKWQIAVLNGLAEGMSRRGTHLTDFLHSLPLANKEILEKTDRLLAQAVVLATDARSSLPDRLAAIRLLAHGPWQLAKPSLARLLNDDPVQEIRLASVRSLAAHAQKDVADLLMKSWKSYTPPLRREVVEAMLARPERIVVFLQRMEDGTVRPSEMDQFRANMLLNYGVSEIRDKARKLLQQAMPADRKVVIEKYRAAITAATDPKRGRTVFQKNCSTCHRVGGQGVVVGPDIEDYTRSKSQEALLTDILNPNQAIDSNFINYVITTKTGKVLTGIIAAETASSVTLRRAENQIDVILRQDIEEFTSTNASLMPEGLEKTISVQDMADLLAYLKNWRYLDGATPIPLTR